MPSSILSDMDGMATYQQLRLEPLSRDLFNNRITTVEDLRNILKDSSFIAIDTEHTPVTSEKDRILHQVGLACIQTLGQENTPRTNDASLSTSHPYLQQFYTKSQIRALTLNIESSKEEQDAIFRLRGGKNMPARRPRRFGRERQVKLEDLEETIIDFIQSCNTKTSLVLIGFEMAAEWTYLFRNFPGAMPFFSAWVDVRDIAKDITPLGVIPGLMPLLQIFGYHWKDLKPARENPNDGISDNAGVDAVASCALADALLRSKNHEKLRFRQQCGTIARIFTRKKGLQSPPDVWDRFSATIRTSGPLPCMINSEMKLARQFFDYSPQFSGIISNEMAYLTFRSQEQLEQFISATHGLVLDTGETLSVQVYYQEDDVTEVRKIEQNEKRDLRERKRLGSTPSEVIELTGFFPE